MVLLLTEEIASREHCFLARMVRRLQDQMGDDWIDVAVSPSRETRWQADTEIEYADHRTRLRAVGVNFDHVLHRLGELLYWSDLTLQELEPEIKEEKVMHLYPGDYIYFLDKKEQKVIS